MIFDAFVIGKQIKKKCHLVSIGQYIFKLFRTILHRMSVEWKKWLPLILSVRSTLATIRMRIIKWFEHREIERERASERNRSKICMKTWMMEIVTYQSKHLMLYSKKKQKREWETEQKMNHLSISDG